jgi:hypothetical protein
MSHAASTRQHLGRSVTAAVPLGRGLAVVWGTSHRRVEVAPPGAQSILGVTCDTVGADEPVRIAEGHDIVDLARDPAFLTAVAPGDRVGVGVGGAFVAADGAPGVAIVEEPDDGTGAFVKAQVAPFASSIVGETLIKHIVLAGEAGTNGVITIALGFTPVGFQVQRFTSIGDTATWSGNVTVSPGQIVLTSGAVPGTSFDAGDQAMIYVRE